MAPRANHIGTTYLTTERLVLRRFRVSDATDMFERWASDPDATRFLTFEPHKDVRASEGVIRSWIADYENPAHYVWAIALSEDSDRPIGSIGGQPDLQNNAMGLGYVIGREWWGNGYVTEAVARLVDYFFDDVHVNRIEIGCDPENHKSQRIAEKLGFRSEGVSREALRLPHRYADLLTFGLLASDERARP